MQSCKHRHTSVRSLNKYTFQIRSLFTQGPQTGFVQHIACKRFLPLPQKILRHTPSSFFTTPLPQLSSQYIAMAATKRTYATAMDQEADGQRFRAFSNRLDASLLQALDSMGYEYIKPNHLQPTGAAEVCVANAVRQICHTRPVQGPLHLAQPNR